jgi:hypothetical protein
MNRFPLKQFVVPLGLPLRKVRRFLAFLNWWICKSSVPSRLPVKNMFPFAAESQNIPSPTPLLHGRISQIQIQDVIPSGWLMS